MSFLQLRVIKYTPAHRFTIEIRLALTPHCCLCISQVAGPELRRRIMARTFFSEYYDVTVKMTFDVLDKKMPLLYHRNC